MTSASPVPDERSALCDLFDQLGPTAPTLCDTWTTADLAAHLFVREHDPIGASGILVPRMAGYTERAMAKALDRLGYAGLVDQIRRGPPNGPFRWFETTMNLNEYFVHHEDVRRGDGDRQPRTGAVADDLDRALWANLDRTAKLMTRSLRGVPLVLDWPGRGAITVRRGTAFLTIAGTPGEITLFLNGRGEAAQVTVDGTDDQLAELREAELGI